MSYNQNTSAFYYEICNLWQSQNMVQKNLQCFFVFTNDKDESYFKVPNLSFKIRNKSDFDTTEVKLWVTYDSLPDLIFTIEKYLADGQNNYIALSGHKYTFFISNYPTNDGQHYTSLKISDSNDNSNDFVMRTNALTFMVNTLKQACENIIKISLDFIKVSQNNDIIKRLTSIEDALKYNSKGKVFSTPTPLMPISSDNQVDVSDTKQAPLPPVDEQSYAPNSNDVQVDMTSNNDVQVDMTSNNDVQVDATKSNDVPFDPPFTTDVMSPKEPIVNTPKNDAIIDGALDHIHNSMKKDPLDKFKAHVISLIKDAKNGNIDLKNLQHEIVEKASIAFAKEDLSFENLSSYFYLTFSSYERVFRKLSMITKLHNYVKTKVPLFIFKCRLNNRYLELTKEMNESLIDLYLEYRSKENGTEDEQYIYACLRYALAPLWSSFLAISEDVCKTRPEILGKIRMIAISTMQENAIEKKLDTFIFDNSLALDIKKDIVEDFFAQYCPTLFECLTNVNGDTPMEDVNMVKDIINQLKDTYAYQEVIFKDWYNTSKLSDNFIRNVYTFNKPKAFNAETPLDKLNEYYTNEVLKKDVNNIRSEFKALSSMDVHNGELKKKTEKPVEPPMQTLTIEQDTKMPNIDVSENESEKTEIVNKPIENSVNPLDFLI